ncbi:LiaF domain-containing protein [Marinilabilia sp.]|uniref:LiaF transmembrane domain-containing protein n=1 Tax=Marinilabilia sp. TaxID=2021252 RepID=UPI0025BB45B2|nr:LiaF domain-containing protein [Marinilabilia sp.]
MEPKLETENTSRSHSLAGAGLIIIGIVLLAGNLGFIPQPVWDVIFRWPTIFLIIAIINLFKKKYIPVLIFTSIWAFFALPDILPSFRSEELKNYWPILLILAGLLFINSHKKNKSVATPRKIKGHPEDMIDEVAIFSGNIKRVESENFSGGEITSIFGGSELYFNNCKLSPDGAVIELVNIFGGSKMVVPRDWNVKIEVTSILGGFADKRVYLNNNGPSKNTLTITGMTIFGGGEITNF